MWHVGGRIYLPKGFLCVKLEELNGLKDLRIDGDNIKMHHRRWGWYVADCTYLAEDI
jgi:hypothetical protein